MGGNLCFSKWKWEKNCVVTMRNTHSSRSPKDEGESWMTTEIPRKRVHEFYNERPVYVKVLRIWLTVRIRTKPEMSVQCCSLHSTFSTLITTLAKSLKIVWIVIFRTCRPPDSNPDRGRLSMTLLSGWKNNHARGITMLLLFFLERTTDDGVVDNIIILIIMQCSHHE